MKAEFLENAMSGLESAQAALEQWVRPATPYLPSELQDTGEYLMAIGCAMKQIEVAVDAVLTAKKRAAALLEPIKKDPGEATAAPSPSDEGDEDEE